MLAGCEAYAPDPLDPRAELQKLVLRPQAHVESAEGPWGKDWFPLEANVQLGDGMSLAEANVLALFSAPAVRAARGEARVADAQVLQAGVLKNPELVLGPRISTKDGQLVFPAGISWDVPLWGTGSAERDVAEARHAELRLRALDVELETLVKVRELYTRLARLHTDEGLLATVAASDERIMAWVEGLQRAGAVDAVSLFLARSERDEALVELEQARVAFRATRRELFLLLGLLPDAKVEPVLDATTLASPELPLASSATLLRHPALRAAEAAYAGADAALRREISRQYPEIRFGPEFEYDRGDPTIGVGLGIRLPLFDRNKGGIAAAEAARTAARERYQSALLTASHAEAKAREELDEARRLSDIHAQGALRDADRVAQALTFRLEAGRADVIEVLTAQRAIARARTRAADLDERIAVARLRAAVAGGLAWQEPAPRSGEEAKQ